MVHIFNKVLMNQLRHQETPESRCAEEVQRLLVKWSQCF